MFGFSFTDRNIKHTDNHDHNYDRDSSLVKRFDHTIDNDRDLSSTHKGDKVTGDNNKMSSLYTGKGAVTCIGRACLLNLQDLQEPSPL
mmetsp:Transcript_8427/g.14108  ORF Transcript_8427/g.14108 Transcript_8427/m.14108 type:complete len:88 (+) Transcript_8427:43-306(+)